MVHWRALPSFVTVAASILFTLSVFGGGASAEPFPSASSSAGVDAGEQPQPSFSVDADKQEGRPGDRVTLTFNSNDDTWVVLGCNAAFSGVRQNCTSSGLDPSVELIVPADASPGPTSIPWTLFYTTAENAGGTHDALPREDGTTPFVVLPPPDVDSPNPSGGGGGGRDGGGGGSVSQPPISVPPAFPPALPPGTTPTAGSGSLPIGIPLLFVVLAAAVLAAALISRRIRAGAAVAAAPGGQTVRVVPHPEPGAQVTVPEAPPGLTHVVRLEPRPGIPTVNVQEEPK